MKKILLLIILIVAGVSCDVLNQAPESDVTDGNFYRNEADIKKAVSGVYAGMRSWPVDIYFYMSEVRSKNFFAVEVTAQRDWSEISGFSINPQIESLQNVWAGCYRMINRSNEILSRIDDIPYTNSADKEQNIAEVRFLRAFAYFQLVRVFNRVPLIDRVISEEEALEIGQSEPTEIYEFITAQMADAIERLPENYDTEQTGKVTKFAAEGILARVYLTMAGYPLQQENYLRDAQPLLEDIINNEGGAIHLHNNFGEMFKAANNNQHFLFEIQFLGDRAGEGNPLPQQVYPRDLNRSIIQYEPYISATRLTIPDDMLNAFPENDARFAATIDTVWENNAVPPQNEFTPYYSKFFDEDVSSTLVARGDWPVNFPVLRYADVLLMYSEVLFRQAGGPTAQSTALLNRVRRRAGLDDITPADAQSFALALENERRREFAFEGHYWFDLVRTGRAVPVMNAWFQDTGQSITIDTNAMVYPIPQSEIDIFPNLYQQNPGY